VVELARQLTDLWDADEGCENAYLDKKPHKLTHSTGEEIRNEIGSWRSGLVEILSFTQAKGLAGALVQMALAVDELETLVSRVSDGGTVPDEACRIQRLVGSAARAVRTSLAAAEYQSVEATLETNGLRHIVGGDWLDSMETWTKEGRAIREKRTEEERPRKAA
jgi:hypothetical protein